MKKVVSFFLILITIFSLTSCKKEEEIRTLRVYNWQDYIDDGTAEENGTSMLDDFVDYYYQEYGEKIEVVYDTFETNETMFNTLKTGKTTYDLVCPSEYMIQRMIKADMLETYPDASTPTYEKYASKYIQDLFKKDGLYEYARCYMWGTVGIVYDPENVNDEDLGYWDILWNENYDGKVSVKDSIRDTYMTGVMYTYFDELMELKAKYDNGTITKEVYNKELSTIMNRCSDDDIKEVLKSLQALKSNLFGFEVDSGKTDIVSGKINMNVAWSGDAVYSMALAYDEDNKELEYMVPIEGSNIFFDGWVMPKGADIELATCFVDFISRPVNAARNMNMVGYTSAIAGDEVLDLVTEWYDESEVEDVELYDYDITYFFEGTISEGKNTILKTSNLNGQLYTQYPDEATVTRCAVMEDFGEQNNKVIEMWTSVKAANLPTWVVPTFISCFVLIIIGIALNSYLKKMRQNRLKK